MWFIYFFGFIFFFFFWFFDFFFFLLFWMCPVQVLLFFEEFSQRLYHVWLKLIISKDAVSINLLFYFSLFLTQILCLEGALILMIWKLGQTCHDSIPAPYISLLCSTIPPNLCQTKRSRICYWIRACLHYGHLAPLLLVPNRLSLSESFIVEPGGNSHCGDCSLEWASVKMWGNGIDWPWGGE